MTAFVTSNLSKRYGQTWALRDCDLSIPPGRVVGLVGPNGAGKSTLLLLLAGLIRPTTGTGEIAGFPLGSEQALAEVAFLSQDHALYRRFRVDELLRLGRTLNPRWSDRMAHDRLARVGIALDRRAGRLSGGQQAQVALTLALAKQAAVVLLDEPVASLDPLARRDFMAELMALVAETGTTVILSSHVVAELERVCDYLVLLSGSEVQVAGEVSELLDVHRRLVGPPDRLPAGVDAVLQRTDGARQSSVLARMSAPLLDPAWQARPVTLEDLAIAYLSSPEQRFRATVRLEVVGGRS
jgi:ABC-2 type transport system ATP-binding protein